MHDRKLFIVGAERSGTTMLQQALNRHPQIAIPAETSYFVDFVGHLRRGQQRALFQIEQDLGISLPPLKKRVYQPDEVKGLFETIAERYLTKLGRDNTRYFGEKSPRHLLVLPRIIRYYPRAKIILIYRDGRDVALSLTKVPWTPRSLYVNFGVWLRYHRWHVWARGQSGIDLHEVRYEDFVTDPESACRAACDFLRLPYVQAMARGSGNQEGIPEWETEWKERATGPIGRERIAVWKEELLPSQIEELERWGGRALAALGYEVSAFGRPSTRVRMRTLYELTLWRVRCAVKLAGRELLPIRPNETPPRGSM